MVCHKTSPKGFTLIEVLITIAVLGLIGTTAMFSLFGYRSRNNFNLDAETLVSAIRDAYSRAENGEEGSAWGIQITNAASGSGYFEVFKGTTYSASNVVVRSPFSAYTQIISPTSGNSTTTIFSARTGTSTAQIAPRLQRTGGSETYTISVSSLGLVSKTSP
jgi:prepilin-type N-terminal cleavage/methylation domain-containing protein